MSCTFRLASLPVDPAAVWVFFDDVTSVLRHTSRTEGWDCAPDAQSMTCYGGARAALRGGPVSEVDVVFACPAPILE